MRKRKQKNSSARKSRGGKTGGIENFKDYPFTAKVSPAHFKAIGIKRK